MINKGSIDNTLEAFTSALKICSTIIKKRSNPTIVAINNIYKQSDKIVYLKFTSKGWKVIDTLNYQSTRVSEDYLSENDFRIKKPWLVFQKNDLHRHSVTNNNWVLEFDNLETLMLQPNDVSIYSNICSQNLQLAQKFYAKTILPRHKHYVGTFPILEQQKEYFDYFQLIITSIIFSYTALEAFVNTCIPDSYTHEEQRNGITTIYSKMAIEKSFSLRDKLKKITSQILNTPDPTKEKWWSKFIELEDLRNEIIHTKQSNFEQRYSTLLSKKIFTLVSIHTEIIQYYGKYVNQNKPELLEEFPYNFGYNNVVPGLAENREFKKWTVHLKDHSRIAKLKEANDRIL